MVPYRIDYAAILPPRRIEMAVEEWINDDTPSFDVGALVVAGRQGTAMLYMKSPGVFAGKPFFDAVFRSMGCHFEWNEELAVEGSFIDPSKLNDSGKIALAFVTGPVARILQGERTALNTLSRCSGVATASAEAVKVAREYNWNGWIAGTRKTTPGSFRIVEKYGLLVGGAATHRLDLSRDTMLTNKGIPVKVNNLGKKFMGIPPLFLIVHEPLKVGAGAHERGLFGFRRRIERTELRAFSNASVLVCGLHDTPRSSINAATRGLPWPI